MWSILYIYSICFLFLDFYDFLRLIKFQILNFPNVKSECIRMFWCSSIRFFTRQDERNVFAIKKFTRANRFCVRCFFFFSFSFSFLFCVEFCLFSVEMLTLETLWINRISFKMKRFLHRQNGRGCSLVFSRCFLVLRSFFLCHFHCLLLFRFFVVRRRTWF